VPPGCIDASYQSVDEVISLKFESFDGMEDVDLTIVEHFLADVPAGTEQSALAGAVNAVYHNRYCLAVSVAIWRTSLNHLNQLHESVARPRRLSNHSHGILSFVTHSSRAMLTSGGSKGWPGGHASPL